MSFYECTGNRTMLIQIVKKDRGVFYVKKHSCDFIA